MVITMPTYENINAVISLASNSPGMPTGYGQQALYLAEKMVRHGIDIAAMSNYGLEGVKSELKIKNGKIPHYPRGLSPYSDDVLPTHHARHRIGKEDLPHAIMTLYDVWVYKNPALKEIPMLSWVPIDHLTVPPMVHEFLAKDNVTPITMAPHGKEQLDALGIENTYIPHGIDTKVYKPTYEWQGRPTREVMGVADDQFLVGMIAANKANRSIHRKAFAENLLAFSLFLKKNPNAVLYIHSEPSTAYGGFDLKNILRATGIPPESVIFPDPMDLRYGYPQKDLAALYTAFDVLLATSYGEGFGVPTMEAQACGTRVIGSNWAATKDLVSEDSYLVDGQPFWDEAQASWFQIPSVPATVRALETANEEKTDAKSETAIQFASDFDFETVWRRDWLPFLKGYFQ